MFLKCYFLLITAKQYPYWNVSIYKRGTLLEVRFGEFLENAILTNIIVINQWRTHCNCTFSETLTLVICGGAQVRTAGDGGRGTAGASVGPWGCLHPHPLYPRPQLP